jgi:hypothetical protein
MCMFSNAVTEDKKKAIDEVRSHAHGAMTLKIRKTQIKGMYFNTLTVKNSMTPPAAEKRNRMPMTFVGWKHITQRIQ